MVSLWTTSAGIHAINTPTAQQALTVEFAELDFSAVEGAGTIDVALTVTGSTSIDLVLVITPFTFDEYQTQFGMRLNEDIEMRAQGIDRAECELSLLLYIRMVHYGIQLAVARLLLH